MNETRTYTAPWLGTLVRITQNKHGDRGVPMHVKDILVNQKTSSGSALKVVVELATGHIVAPSRQNIKHTVDYADIRTYT